MHRVATLLAKIVLLAIVVAAIALPARAQMWIIPAGVTCDARECVVPRSVYARLSSIERRVALRELRARRMTYRVVADR